MPVLKNELIPSVSGQRGLRAFLTLRQLLVVAQVALSLMALIAAGLFLRELRHAQQIDTGFETRGVLVMNFNLLREGYTPQRGQVFFDQMVEKAARAARRAGRGDRAGPAARRRLRAQRVPRGADTTTTGRILVQVNTVGTGYFQTHRHSARSAAATSRAPTPPRRPKVVVVNETMARQFWKGEDAARQALQVLRRPGLHDRHRRGEGQQVQRRRRRPAELHLPAAVAELHAAGDAARADGGRRRLAGQRRARRGARARSVALGLQRPHPRGTGQQFAAAADA